MRKFKYVIAFAAFGFILSFVSGLFSHLSFLSVLLKAFIFAIVFAILGFILTFLVRTFLLGEGGSDGDGEISNIATSRSEGNSKGNLVDIVIHDEELPVSDTGNHFVVGNQHQMLIDSDIGGSIPQQQKITQLKKMQEEEKDSSFVPIRVKENPSNVSGKEAITPDSIKPSMDSQIHDYEDTKENDTVFRTQKKDDDLPEITGFNIENNEESSSDDEDNSDDDSGQSYSNYSSSSSQSSKSNGLGMELKDASLYAKAISSILSGEEN